MKIKNRIKGLKQIKASLLVPNPRNWRTHPTAQADALKGLLAEVGIVGAVIARKLPDGTYQIVDGHLRAETMPDQTVPVLEVDLTDEEVDKVLAAYDAIGDLAGTDQEKLDELLASIDTESEALQALFDQLAEQEAVSEEVEEDDEPDEEAPAVELHVRYEVVLECADEADQRTMYERLTKEGRRCRVLTL